MLQLRETLIVRPVTLGELTSNGVKLLHLVWSERNLDVPDGLDFRKL